MKLDAGFVFENARWPVMLVDGAGVVQFANQAASEIFGAIEIGKTVLGKSLWSARNEAGAGQIIKTSEQSWGHVNSLYLQSKSGQTLQLQCSVSHIQNAGTKLYLFQFFNSVSAPPEASSVAKTGSENSAGRAGETLSVEASLAHKQKLDCAMQLIRTVALDFNNALTSILGHTSLILSRMEPAHPWRSSLVEVEKSAEKAAEIANDLAAFSRQEKDNRTHVAGNLNDLLRRTVEVFQSSANHRVTWELQLESRLYTVNFDEAKMQQAFIKVLDNAIQSLQGKARIRVSTKNQDFEHPQQDGTLRLSPGSYVCVEFEDTGCGIPADVLPRIFEPFFTTKKAPAHRGLGLAWVYGIVTNHGGSVGVSSKVGEGTIVRIYLPATKKFVKDSSVKGDDLTGSQTILMIDDEDLLLTMGETILSSFGYTVLTANNGPKALEIFSENSGNIDLVITDLVMPKMSGRELIDHLRRLSPKVQIICSSGYVRAANTEEEEAYLQKPFTSQELLRKVKQALSSSESV